MDERLGFAAPAQKWSSHVSPCTMIVDMIIIHLKPEYRAHFNKKDRSKKVRYSIVVER